MSKDSNEIITGEKWTYHYDPKADPEEPNASIVIWDVDADDNGQPTQNETEFCTLYLYDPTITVDDMTLAQAEALEDDVNEHRLALMCGAPSMKNAIEHALDLLKTGYQQDTQRAVQLLKNSLIDTMTKREQEAETWKN